MSTHMHMLLQSARGPRISGWYEDVSIYTLIHNILAYNKIINLHDYVELGLGKVRVGGMMLAVRA